LARSNVRHSKLTEILNYAIEPTQLLTKQKSFGKLFNNKIMQTVEKALDILQVFLKQEGEIGIAALVNLSRLNISPVQSWIRNFSNDVLHKEEFFVL